MNLTNKKRSALILDWVGGRYGEHFVPEFYGEFLESTRFHHDGDHCLNSRSLSDIIRQITDRIIENDAQ